MSIVWTNSGQFRLTRYSSESDFESAIVKLQRELFGGWRIQFAKTSWVAFPFGFGKGGPLFSFLLCWFSLKWKGGRVARSHSHSSLTPTRLPDRSRASSPRGVSTRRRRQQR